MCNYVITVQNYETSIIEKCQGVIGFNRLPVRVLANQLLCNNLPRYLCVTGPPARAYKVPSV